MAKRNNKKELTAEQLIEKLTELARDTVYKVSDLTERYSRNKQVKRKVLEIFAEEFTKGIQEAISETNEKEEKLHTEKRKTNFHEGGMVTDGHK